MKYKNGQIWQAPSFTTAVLQYLIGENKYCLLEGPAKARHGGTCLNIVFDKNGKWKYDYDELSKRLERWTLLSDKSLRLFDAEDIDLLNAMRAKKHLTKRG